MKILCETTGEFELVDFEQDLVILSTRPTVARPTTFISTRAGLGQIRVLTNLNEEATDEEFAQYIKDSEDQKLAIASFSEAYSAEAKRQESVELPVRTKNARSPQRV